MERDPESGATFPVGFQYFGFVLRNRIPPEVGGRAGGRAQGEQIPAEAADDVTGFWMRAPQREAKEWTDFFADSMRRFKQADEFADPNPAKWRARVRGLDQMMRRAELAAIDAGEAAKEAAKLRADEEQRRANAETEEQWARLQAASAAQRASEMARYLDDARRQQEAVREQAAQALADAERLREHAKELLQQAAEEEAALDTAAEEEKQRTRRAEADLRAAEIARDEARAETRRVFARWRQCEERAPVGKDERGSDPRARRREGLRYSAPNNPKQWPRGKAGPLPPPADAETSPLREGRIYTAPQPAEPYPKPPPPDAGGGDGDDGAGDDPPKEP